MSGILRNVYFVMENLEIADIFQRFSIFLKLENYELVKIGDFVKNELPFGLNFPVLLAENWFENPEFEVEIHTKNVIFAGILEVEKQEKSEMFSTTGTATVFNVKDAAEQLEFACTMLIEEPKIERRESGENRETQTENKKNRDGGCQTTPPPSPPPPVSKTDSSTMTLEGQISLSEAEMKEIVMKNIEMHLKSSRHQRNAPVEPGEPENPEELEVEDPKPSAPGHSQLPLNSYNLVPRLTRLRDLDALIAEKTRVLKELELQIEVQRKIRKINEMREDIRKRAEPVSAQEDSKSESKSTSSSSSSSSASDDSESSESSSEESSESSTSTSESSKKSTEPPKAPSPEKEKKDEEESIDDPFSELHSSAGASEIQEVLSPASQYLVDMRKRIAESYGFN